jgi:hypothetical protein
MTKLAAFDGEGRAYTGHSDERARRGGKGDLGHDRRRPHCRVGADNVVLPGVGRDQLAAAGLKNTVSADRPKAAA